MPFAFKQFVIRFQSNVALGQFDELILKNCDLELCV